MVFVVTGCPHNQYIVQLKPRGNTIERTLVFYREDGQNTNTGAPNYQFFDGAELASITSLYPTQGQTNDGERHVVRGEFTNQLPHDVGGAGVYTNLTTSLGEVGFYVERFRGNDDLAGMAERRDKAADRLTDLVVGWSQMELGREPGYDKLRQFLEVDFRHDLKNLGAYWWEGELVNAYRTNAAEEFAVRFGQYLLERAYFKIGEIPDLFKAESENYPQALVPRIQRLVARKMGVPETERVPASLAFLADETMTEKSFDKYLASTDLYRAKLKQWEEDKKLKPDTKQPEPSELVGDAIGDLVDFNLFGPQPDHLTVRLSLPSSPVHSNGRWDEALKQVVWETDLNERTNATHVPFSCYASWAQPDREYQKKHFGKVVLTGDELTQYCLWRSGQNTQQGGEWDAFVASLQPGSGLVERLDAFRFSGEPAQPGTNDPQKILSPSSYPRELLKTALR
jgi:hypothetical protein